MRAAPNFGPDYVRAFDAIYPELAAANDLVFYPFFLDGIVADPKLNISDGLHPTGEGVARIVDGHFAQGRGPAGAGPCEAASRARVDVTCAHCDAAVIVIR